MIVYYKENCVDFNDNFCLKMYCMLSWLKKVNEEENLDFKFIVFWIVFNVVYVDELNKEEVECKVFY